jgi:quercetin dioxygenase-like cupin family protein
MQDAFINHAEAFLLGILDHDEEQDFTNHLASGCVECKKAVAETARVMRTLPLAYLQIENIVPPPASLKERLLSSIKAEDGQSLSAGSCSEMGSASGFQVWKKWHGPGLDAPVQPSGLLMVRANEGNWEDIGKNGIQVKQLYVDPAQDAVTMLVRMPAGTSYPRHRHAGAEQCYVLDGDLRVGDVTLRPGDYQCARAESIHEVQYTEGGCLLLIVSSQHDEIIEGNGT